MARTAARARSRWSRLRKASRRRQWTARSSASMRRLFISASGKRTPRPRARSCLSRPSSRSSRKRVRSGLLSGSATRAISSTRTRTTARTASPIPSTISCGCASCSVNSLSPLPAPGRARRSSIRTPTRRCSQRRVNRSSKVCGCVAERGGRAWLAHRRVRRGQGEDRD